MKPIQVTILKPEPEDWDALPRKQYYHSAEPQKTKWVWRIENAIIDKKYTIELFMDGDNDVYQIWGTDVFHNSLSEAQEACFQHYLKEITTKTED